MSALYFHNYIFCNNVFFLNLHHYLSHQTSMNLLKLLRISTSLGIKSCHSRVMQVHTWKAHLMNKPGQMVVLLKQKKH